MITVSVEQSPLQDFDNLWDFNNPAETEKKFRALLPKADPVKDRGLRLELLTQIARTLGLRSKYDSANKILDGIQKELTPDLQRVNIRYLLERGRTFNSSGKPEMAKPLFLQAVEIAAKSNEDALYVDAAHMMAIVEKNAGDQPNGNLKALAIAERSKESRAQNWKGSLYNNIGWTYHDEKQFEKALDMFQKALAERVSQNQPQNIKIARWSVARVQRSLNRLAEAFAIQLDLLKLNEANNDPDPYVQEELGELYTLEGRTVLAQKHFAAAYRLLLKDKWFVDNMKERLARIKELGNIKE